MLDSELLRPAAPHSLAMAEDATAGAPAKQMSSRTPLHALREMTAFDRGVGGGVGVDAFSAALGCADTFRLSSARMGMDGALTLLAAVDIDAGAGDDDSGVCASTGDAGSFTVTHAAAAAAGGDASIVCMSDWAGAPGASGSGDGCGGATYDFGGAEDGGGDLGPHTAYDDDAMCDGAEPSGDAAAEPWWASAEAPSSAAAQMGEGEEEGAAAEMKSSAAPASAATPKPAVARAARSRAARTAATAPAPFDPWAQLDPTADAGARTHTPFRAGRTFLVLKNPLSVAHAGPARAAAAEARRAGSDGLSAMNAAVTHPLSAVRLRDATPPLSLLHFFCISHPLLPIPPLQGALISRLLALGSSPAALAAALATSGSALFHAELGPSIARASKSKGAATASRTSRAARAAGSAYADVLGAGEDVKVRGAALQPAISDAVVSGGATGGDSAAGSTIDDEYQEEYTAGGDGGGGGGAGATFDAYEPMGDAEAAWIDAGADGERAWRDEVATRRAAAERADARSSAGIDAIAARSDATTGHEDVDYWRSVQEHIVRANGQRTHSPRHPHY